MWNECKGKTFFSPAAGPAMSSALRQATPGFPSFDSQSVVLALSRQKIVGMILALKAGALSLILCPHHVFILVGSIHSDPTGEKKQEINSEQIEHLAL